MRVLEMEKVCIDDFELRKPKGLTININNKGGVDVTIQEKC